MELDSVKYLCIDFHHVIFILISVIVCFLGWSLYKSWKCHTESQPCPFSPIMLCRRGMKNVFVSAVYFTCTD